MKPFHFHKPAMKILFSQNMNKKLNRTAYYEIHELQVLVLQL